MFNWFEDFMFGFCYSARRASMGLIRAARRAGSHDARSAMARRRRAGAIIDSTPAVSPRRNIMLVTDDLPHSPRALAPHFTADFIV